MQADLFTRYQHLDTLTMNINIAELDKIYLKNKGDYSQLVKWKNGKRFYKVINDTTKTFKLYELTDDGVVLKTF